MSVLLPVPQPRFSLPNPPKGFFCCPHQPPPSVPFLWVPWLVGPGITGPRARRSCRREERSRCEQNDPSAPRCGARLGAAPVLGTSTPGMGTGLPSVSCIETRAASGTRQRVGDPTGWAQQRRAPAQLPASWGTTNREGKKALNKWKWAEHPPQGPCCSADLAARHRAPPGSWGPTPQPPKSWGHPGCRYHWGKPSRAG